jgi:hypothetical protein
LKNERTKIIFRHIFGEKNEEKSKCFLPHLPVLSLKIFQTEPEFFIEQQRQ